MFVERDVFKAPSSRKTLDDLGKLSVELEIPRKYLKNGGDNGASFGMDKGAIRVFLLKCNDVNKPANRG